MSLPQSKVTAQGQISVPAEVRKKLGVGPGSVLEWHESDGGVVVRRAGVSVPPMSTTRDFPQGAPKGKSVPYVTHGHADHFFGFAPLLERFPHAKAVATPELVTAMRAQLVPDSIDGFWLRLFSRRNSRTAVGGRATGGWSTGSGGTHARHFECGTDR